MTNSDFNSIKPIESLHNIGNITPANNNQEKKKQQKQQHHDNCQNEINKNEINLSNNEELDIQLNSVDIDKHFIDYHA